MANDQAPESFFNVNHALLTAIAARRLIEFTYLGRRRTAEPHDYGILNGARKVLVYQIRGGRSPIPGWRLMEVNAIADLVVLGKTFPGSRGASHRHHYHWDNLFARVE